MSSASSTARWIDCTVDSMLTTTPFLRPRDGCTPRPMASMEPSALCSPTSATTLEVPMSRPTITLRSIRLGIRGFTVRCGPGRESCGTVPPANGEAVGVAHVDVGDVGGACRHQAQRHVGEAREALVDLPPAHAHADAVVEGQVPGAARIEMYGGQAHAGLDQLALDGEISRRDQRLGALRAGQQRQFGRNEA